MKCPACDYDHTAKAGRLLALVPIYGLEKISGQGVSSHMLAPNHYLSRERWQKVECGTLVECMKCGNKFGVNGEGAFALPAPQPQQPVQPLQPRRNGPVEPEPRPAHLPDEDLAMEPRFD